MDFVSIFLERRQYCVHYIGELLGLQSYPKDGKS